TVAAGWPCISEKAPDARCLIARPSVRVERLVIGYFENVALVDVAPAAPCAHAPVGEKPGGSAIGPRVAVDVTTAANGGSSAATEDQPKRNEGDDEEAFDLHGRD